MQWFNNTVWGYLVLPERSKVFTKKSVMFLPVKFSNMSVVFWIRCKKDRNLGWKLPIKFVWSHCLHYTGMFCFVRFVCFFSDLTFIYGRSSPAGKRIVVIQQKVGVKMFHSTRSRDKKIEKKSVSAAAKWYTLLGPACHRLHLPSALC